MVRYKGTSLILVSNRSHTGPTPVSFENLTKVLGIDHIQGPGRLQKQKHQCPVQFEVIEPLSLQETPYLLLVARGEHTHLPPPIHQVPQAIKGQIVDLFIRINDPNLTLSKLYTIYLDRFKTDIR